MPSGIGGPTLPAMAQLGPLLSPLLVGRDDLLDLAERRIAEAAGGRGQLLLLAGEAGIGKTRLMRADPAQGRGRRVPDRPGRPRRPRTASCRWRPSSTSPGPCASRPGSARWARSSSSYAGGDGGDTLGSRRMLVRDIADAIVAAVDQPTLLAFEDLQWADEVSLEVIGELARLGARPPRAARRRLPDRRAARRTRSTASGGPGCSASASRRRRGSRP